MRNKHSSERKPPPPTDQNNGFNLGWGEWACVLVILGGAALSVVTAIFF